MFLFAKDVLNDVSSDETATAGNQQWFFHFAPIRFPRQPMARNRCKFR